MECAQNIWNLLRGSKLAQLHEEEVSLEEDRYLLRQDRYPLRTAPQFLGPQIEDILAAHVAIIQECNSSAFCPFSASEFSNGNAVVKPPITLSLRVRPALFTTAAIFRRCQ